MNYRLDVYANDKEIWGEEAEMTPAGFESLLQLCPSLWKSVDQEIRENGVADLNSAQIEDEDFQDRLWDILGRDPSGIERVSFVMCTWNDGEHMKSCVGK